MLLTAVIPFSKVGPAVVVPTEQSLGARVVAAAVALALAAQVIRATAVLGLVTGGAVADTTRRACN